MFIRNAITNIVYKPLFIKYLKPSYFRAASIRPLHCFKNSTLIEPSNAGKSCIRGNSSSVESYRHYELLKQNSTECLTALKKGKFLVFYEKSVLIDQKCMDVFEKQLVPIDLHRHYAARWLLYSDIIDIEPDLENVLVDRAYLLGVDNNLNPLFALDLPKLDSDTEAAITHKYEGIFASMGMAMFIATTNNHVSFGQAHSVIRWHRINKFCSRCGNSTIRHENGLNRICTSCKKTNYPKPDPAAITIVTDEIEKKCLLVRQPNFPKGMFTAIAGFLELGETIEETVRREVAEEVGLELKAVQYITSQHWPLMGTTLMMGFHAIVEPGSQVSVDKKELETARWFSFDEVKSAIEKSDINPGLRFGINAKQSDMEYWVPPPPTIANLLLQAWLQKYADEKS